MARGLSFSDAAGLLGGRDNKTVAALDQLTGGLLLAVSAVGGGFALSLFDPRSELARLSADLVSSVGSRLSGVGRLTRSERLAAAHAVVVLTAYFESLERLDLPFAVAELEMTAAEQVSVAGGAAPGPSGLRELAEALLRSDVPMPAPHSPYERTLESLHDFYGRLSRQIWRFASGLAVWDRLDDTARERFRHAVRAELPERAVARYEELFRRLAGEFPEVAFWTALHEHQATRGEVRRLGMSVLRAEQLLAGIAVGRAPDERRHALSRAYQAVLNRPVLASDHVSPNLLLPTLGQIYVNPDFRVAAASAPDQLAKESWWRDEPVRQGLHGFLIGCLTTPQSVTAPLLVLGQPGSGKSALTQILAGQLPASDFLVVRVILREVPADADVQAQIEHAIRAATGESLTWPELARTADGALPVVLLDGFDELLQATGVSQSDYLERVAAFQQREADQGRPVAVMVTSRIAVADRARPVAGMLAVRIEPFNETQIAHWLGVWNGVNASHLAERGVAQLPLEVVLAHPELAAQPLLLLMLGLYDAEGNGLRTSDGPLGQGELYERLLRRFVERETAKSGAALSPAEVAHAVDAELTRLSVVAFAMFNRNRQWVSRQELDADLLALLGDSVSAPAPGTLRGRLTVGEMMVGRFFFIHEAKALRDDSELSAYEFLHATFGEYLISRLVARELSDLAAAAEHAASRTRASVIDDGFLHALLSFTALTNRATAVSFLIEALSTFAERQRRRLRDLLLALFHDALQARRTGAYDSYQPKRVSAPSRYAAYSANLALLLVLVGDTVSSYELFPGHREPVSGWRSIAHLWRSQLTAEGWSGLVHTLGVVREWRDGKRDVRLRLDRDDYPTPAVDPYWSYRFPPELDKRGALSRWRNYGFEDLRRHSYFMAETSDDTLMHALEPFAATLDAAVGAFHGFWREGAVSPANALVNLWITANGDGDLDALLTAYERCLHIVVKGSLDVSDFMYCRLVLRQLAHDRERLPPEWLADVTAQMFASGMAEAARELLGESPAPPPDE